MGALPRPDIPPGAQRDLNDALHDLHHRAGWPSLRVLAREAGCSHTTVSHVFSSPRLPAWGVLELLVEAMRGDVGHFHSLWLEASAPHAPTGDAGPRIAGRRRELAVVRRHLVSGSGLLLVAGEAGMGKTRLVSTAAGLDAGDVFVAPGSCLPLSIEVPFLPVADVLRAVHAVDEGQWVKEALADCAAYVPGSLRHLLPELDVGGLEPEPADDWSRQRLFNAVEATLTALAGQRPIALLVEDLHWADSATLDLLEHVLARGATVRVLGTWRLEDPGTAPAALDWFTRVQRMASVEVLELPALTREETREQLSLLLAGPPGPALVDRIHGRSQGQPLFTDQLAAQHGGSEAMPRLLVDLLDRRLEGLGDEAWAVARTLGVADRPLRDSQLGEITGLTPEGLTGGLRDLGARRLLAEPSGQREAQLRHPLLAEAVRRHLVGGEAADQHRRLAQALAAGPDPSPAEVATHWRAAGEPGHELDWRIRAARAAEDRFALAAAAEQWLRVLELWPPGEVTAGSPPVTRWTACAAAGDALDGSGQDLRASDLYEAALEWAPYLLPDEAADLYARAGHCRSYMQHPRAGLPLLDKSIALFERLPPSSDYLRALWLRAMVMRECNDLEQAAANLETAVAVSQRIGDRVQERRLNVLRAWIAFVRGDRSAALDRMADLATLVLSRPDPPGDLYLAVNYTDLLLLNGADPDVVEEAARRGMEAARIWELGSHVTDVTRGNVAEAAWRAGQVGRAAALIDPVTDAPESTVRCIDVLRALLDVLRGDFGSSDRLWGHDPLPAVLAAQYEPCAAEVDLWCGRPDRALDRLLPCLEESFSGGSVAWMGEVFALTARAAADAAANDDTPGHRRRQALVQRLGQLRSAAGEAPFDSNSPDVSRSAAGASYAAEMARLADRPTVEVWVAAATEWDRINRPHESAYCRWRAAQVALAAGQATMANTLLRRAAHDAREHVPLREDIAATSRDHVLQ